MISGFVQKTCPKCGGNIYLESDSFGWYEKCLQCCRSWEVPGIVEVEQSAEGDLVHAKESAQVR